MPGLMPALPRGWERRMGHIAPLDSKWWASIEGSTRALANAEFDTVDQAVEWARGRAPRVRVRFDHPRAWYSAGEVPIDGLQGWPPSAAQLVEHARAATAARWRERADSAPPMRWAVIALLFPLD